MGKTAALAALLALFTFGCAAGSAVTKEPTETKQTYVKCPKCGAEFKINDRRSVP